MRRLGHSPLLPRLLFTWSEAVVCEALLEAPLSVLTVKTADFHRSSSTGEVQLALACVASVQSTLLDCCELSVSIH